MKYYSVISSGPNAETLKSGISLIDLKVETDSDISCGPLANLALETT